MKKTGIYVMAEPFTMKQQILVAKDSSVLVTKECERFSEISDLVILLANQYSISDIFICSPKAIGEGIERQIKENELVSYKEYKLNIQLI